MTHEPNILRSKKFQLTVPFQHLHNLYPALAQSCIIKNSSMQQELQHHSSEHIKLELILYYTLQDKQTISYKLVKTQRLLTVLSRLSRSLKNFIPIQEVLKIQHCPQKTGSNKSTSPASSINRTINSKKQSPQHTCNPQLEYYTQKGWNIFQHHINRYHSLIAMLRKSPSQALLNSRSRNRLSQPQQLRQLFKRLIKQSVNKIKIPQGSISSYKQDVKQLRQNIVQIVNKLAQKYQCIIQQFVEQLRQQAERDGISSDFLHANHKFYKIQMGQINPNSHFQSDHSEEILAVNVELAIKFLLKVFVQSQSLLQESINPASQHETLHSQHHPSQRIDQSSPLHPHPTTKQSPSLKSLNVSNFHFLLDWNLHDIQKTSTHLQSVYLYTNDKYDKLHFKLNHDNPSGLVIKRFCNEFKQHLVYDSIEELKKVFMMEDFIYLEGALRLGKFSLSKQSKNEQQSNQLKLAIQGVVFEGVQHQTFQVQQMSILNQNIEQQQKIFQEKKQQQQQLQHQATIVLTRNQSMDLLSLFYKYYFTTIHCFIQCEKQWYFINLKVKDNNFRDRYNTMVKWIPLVNSQAKKGQLIKSKVSDWDYSTFVDYISSLAYTLMQVKNNLTTISENNNHTITMQNPSYSRTRQFIYNDAQNILVYDDFTFQNIEHCQYYLRNCNNDNRHQFEDRSWVEGMRCEWIRLSLKDMDRKKEHDSLLDEEREEEKLSIGQQQQEDSRRLITIPVRGRYCRHLSFFDLSQVYPSIFPTPNSPPHPFTCPKCLSQIQFQQLIYLKQVQTLLQYIKMFYLQQHKMGINYVVKKHLMSQQKINKELKKDRSREGKIKVKKIKDVMKKKQEIRVGLGDEQFSQGKYLLKELMLIVDHRSQSVKLNGKYAILPSSPSDSQKSYRQSEQIFNHNFSNQSQNIIHSQFQYSLPQEIYQTLLNPNKGFKSNKKLKNILFNFGKNTKNSPNQFYNQHNKLNDDFLESELSFEQQIKLAHKIVGNRWQLYRDLEKGTISI